MDRFVILMLGVLVGTLPSYVGDLGAEAGAEEKVKPVYVLVSAEVKSAPEGLKAYSDAARPMAMAAWKSWVGLNLCPTNWSLKDHGRTPVVLP